MNFRREIPFALLPFAAAWIFAAGCSPAPRDFGMGGAGGGSGSAHGAGGASGQNSSSSSGMSGGGGSFPTVCAPGMAPWAGPLCGPPGLPCKSITDEVLQDPPNSRIGPPSIAVDASCSPQILFDNNIGKFNGFYAVRIGPSNWTIEPTPFEITSSGFTILPDGTPLVIGDDHAVWQKPKGGIWASAAPIGAGYLGFADSFARDPGGSLHMALYNFMDNNAYYGKLQAGTNAWTINQIAPMVSTPFPIALSAAGEPHLTYWNSMGAAGWFLNWASPPGQPEVAMQLGSNLLDTPQQHQKLVVTAADAGNPSGRPHVVFVRDVKGSPQIHELVMVERDKPSSWVVTSLDTENPMAKFCSGMPSQGQTCNFDYEELATLGLVASRGGDLRYVYAKIHHVGSSIGVCQPPPQNFCSWSVQTDNSTGEVRVGWLDQNNKPASASVVSKVMPDTARVVVDTIGHMHVALLDKYPPGQKGFTVRYLEIGP